MNPIKSVVQKLSNIKSWFLKTPLRNKLIIIAVIISALWFGIPRIISTNQQQPQYQTAQAEKGTLIVSVAASGQVSAVNSASVTTQTSGVINKVYVKNNQPVKTGDQIAAVDLDMDGKQRAAQALASYQNAKISLDNARNNLYSLQSDMFTKWKVYMDLAQSGSYQNSDGSPKTDQRALPQFFSPMDDWLATEAKYKEQQSVIQQAQTSLNSAWASYQQSSPTIYAPISGTINGLSLQPGSVLTAQTGSSGSSTAQRIANVKTDAMPTITVNLTQVDAPKIKIGNQATLTLDAFPGKTFTGNVISIDTIGIISSGVTTYPAFIQLDTGAEEIFPNMSAQANIITQTKDNIILVPQSAVQTQNEQSLVQVLKNGNPQIVSVETGLASNSQIEIISGLAEGDIVITSVIQSTAASQRSNQTPSSFGALGGGGGAFRRTGGN